MAFDLLGTAHEVIHTVVAIDYPHGHWWMVMIAAAVFVIAPTWTAWHAARLALHGFTAWRLNDFAVPAFYRRERTGQRLRLESFVLEATPGLQARLVLLSALIIPGTWLMLEVPKHIINHALAEEVPRMDFLGLKFDRIGLLFALCGSYLVVLTANNLLKYVANVVRGRVNERLVRRLRLAVVRRQMREGSPADRSTLAAVAIQECEPIGYFGGSLAVVPLIYGGTLVTSLAFLLAQDAALALAAVMMLPVQLTILPRLQMRLNDKVRERVHATRSLGAVLAQPPGAVTALEGNALSVWRQIRLVERLEQLRLEINELKSRMKGLYNYTSNLTPFFFFAIGGYLVVQQRLTLGALVAALAAYKEIAPSLKELFDFAQNWSDARSRFAEVKAVVSRRPCRDLTIPPVTATAKPTSAVVQLKVRRRRGPAHGTDQATNGAHAMHRACALEN